ncbi:MAG TPA: hypothetical protein VF189_02910 [Patescibacteria group bacterium]
MSENLGKGGPENALSKACAEAKLRRDEVARMESEAPLHPSMVETPRSARRPDKAGPAKKQ